jgi:sulfoxide reductase catalytic subunit YedY
MAYGWKNKLTAAHVTPETKFWSRRQIMAGMAATGMAGGIAGSALAAEDALVPNSFEDISSYNNYYEFGTGKGDPAANAGSLTVDPWKITVGGAG